MGWEVGGVEGGWGLRGLRGLGVGGLGVKGDCRLWVEGRGLGVKGGRWLGVGCGLWVVVSCHSQRIYNM